MPLLHWTATSHADGRAIRSMDRAVTAQKEQAAERDPLVRQLR